MTYVITTPAFKNLVSGSGLAFFHKRIFLTVRMAAVRYLEYPFCDSIECLLSLEIYQILVFGMFQEKYKMRFYEYIERLPVI